MVARTGWGPDAVIAEMKVNEYNFVNHQHLDAGAFQLYYKGALAIDSGLYSGSSGQYGSPHCQNYYWRTVAHNSLLVFDPQEDFGRRGYGNDGGQRLAGGRSEARSLEVLLDPAKGYRTGRVLSHGFGPDPQTPEFTLLQGDLTAAYSKKVRQVLRSFAFLDLRDPQVPAALVVFDRVVSSDASFRKFWLLHTQEEPRLDCGSAVVDCTQHDQRGRLTLDVLLPGADNRQLASIGGPGKEFWVFGTNYANDVEAARRERSSLEAGCVAHRAVAESGRGRRPILDRDAGHRPDGSRSACLRASGSCRIVWVRTSNARAAIAWCYSGVTECILRSRLPSSCPDRARPACWSVILRPARGACDAPVTPPRAKSESARISARRGSRPLRAPGVSKSRFRSRSRKGLIPMVLRFACWAVAVGFVASGLGVRAADDSPPRGKFIPSFAVKYSGSEGCSRSKSSAVFGTFAPP